MSTRKFEIRSTLRTHLLAMDNLPVNKTEINWENKFFEPTEIDGIPQPYIRETLMISDEFLSANGEKTAIGIYQLDFFTPLGSDVTDAENSADNIKEHFRPAQVLSGKLKIEKSNLEQGKPDGSWYFIPIRINYRTHQIN